MTAPATFTGFGPEVFTFFEGLEVDNSKAYFEAHRPIYLHQIREPLEALLNEVASHTGGTIKIFRPNRDIRFSKDKSPYKTSTYGVVFPDDSAAGIYAAIDASGFVTGTGYYGMEADQLERFREQVAGSSGEDLPGIVDTVKSSGLSIEGNALKTAPRGYAKDHPRIELLRMKDLWTTERLADRNAVFTRAPYDLTMHAWTSAAPLVGWLDRHVGPSASGIRGEKPS